MADETTPPKPSANPAGTLPPGDVAAACPLSELVVHVRQDTAAGGPVPDATVTISGPHGASATTDAAGSTRFAPIPHGAYDIAAQKTDLLPAPALGKATLGCGDKQELTLVLTQAIVVKISAKVGGTHGVRKPATDKRASNVLRSSTSEDESLAGNAPVILVRGCKDVKLEAATVPANFPVTWEVKSNENTDGPPALTVTDGGRKASLKSNVHGSFSVIASLGGKKVVWNVVFVWVKVDIASAVVTLRQNKYSDNGSNAADTKFRSGQFVVGEYPWEVQVDVKVVGGGNSKRLGTDKVKLHCLHNGVADTLSGLYLAPGVSATEVPLGGLPIRDSNVAADPWMDNPTTVLPNNTGFQRQFWTADAPTGSFPRRHQNSNTAIQRITGVNGFRFGLASVSDHAPNALMVHAQMKWTADFSGNVSAAGQYTPSTAQTTADATLVLVSSGTGGKDAGLAGFETFEPRFNGGTDTLWVP